MLLVRGSVFAFHPPPLAFRLSCFFLAVLAIPLLDAAGGRPLARNEREPLRMADRINRQVDVEIRPVKMMRLRTLDVCQLGNRRIPEPGEFRKRHEKLLLAKQQPEAVLGDIRDFSVQSVCAKRYGWHPRAFRLCSCWLPPPQGKTAIGASREQDQRSVAQQSSPTVRARQVQLLRPACSSHRWPCAYGTASPLPECFSASE